MLMLFISFSGGGWRTGVLWSALYGRVLKGESRCTGHEYDLQYHHDDDLQRHLESFRGITMNLCSVLSSPCTKNAQAIPECTSLFPYLPFYWSSCFRVCSRPPCSSRFVVVSRLCFIGLFVHLFKFYLGEFLKKVKDMTGALHAIRIQIRSAF